MKKDAERIISLDNFLGALPDDVPGKADLAEQQRVVEIQRAELDAATSDEERVEILGKVVYLERPSEDLL